MQFEPEWSENGTSIPWQQDGRRQLNKVIREFNDWQIRGCPPEPRIGNLIEWGKQTFGRVDGGEEWLATLERMEAVFKGQSGSRLPQVDSRIDQFHNLTIQWTQAGFVAYLRGYVGRGATVEAALQSLENSL